MRKKWIKVYPSKEQRHLLRRIAEGLGIDESAVLRHLHGAQWILSFVCIKVVEF